MDEDITLRYPIGSRPVQHFIPYLIFISYVVSLIGAITTVELLHRRASGTGWRSWVQLAACSISFGLVAIWCMHFVGNRAIVLGHGEDDIQLYYSASFTAVSAILPIVVIFLGLLTADRFYKGNRSSTVRYIALLICGVCVGAAVTEMHYLGNQGTTDYHLVPKWQFIIGAAAIAVGASLIAFSLFFHWSGHWMNNIWRRLLVAGFLAVAVSGLHWTAAAGTSYELRGYHTGSGQARNTNLIIAVCLCLSACGVCFAIGFIKQLQDRKQRDRAEQVVLATVTFDIDGRLLVTSSGLLPCQTITRQFHQRTFDEDFSPRHPLFQWLYRVSRNWGGIVDLIPSMRDHLQTTGVIQINTPAKRGSSRSSFGDEDHTSYSATFREMFCVAAQDLARSMETRLQDLGVLFEDVTTTGTLLTKTFFKDSHGKPTVSADVSTTAKDVEIGLANPILFGRGQLLILTRVVMTDEASRLQNIGYRFASMEQVGDHLARSLQVSREDLANLVSRIESSCTRDPLIPRGGTYLASFLLRPSPTFKGLDVVVLRQAPDRLPMIKLADVQLTPRQLQLLANQFNGLSLHECLLVYNTRNSWDQTDDAFLQRFRIKMTELAHEVPEPALRHAIFSSRQIDVAHGLCGQTDQAQATLLAFCGIKEVYNQSLQSPRLQSMPLDFFRANLRCYPGSPDHAILAQENHKEFANLFAMNKEANSGVSRERTGWSSKLRTKKSKPSSLSDTVLHTDSSSESGLCKTISPDPSSNSSHPFGGIMVSQDVVISEDHKNKEVELQDLGFRTEAGVADTEQLTMADRLMSITTAFRDPHARALTREMHGRR